MLRHVPAPSHLLSSLLNSKSMMIFLLLLLLISHFLWWLICSNDNWCLHTLLQKDGRQTQRRRETERDPFDSDGRGRGCGGNIQFDEDQSCCHLCPVGHKSCGGGILGGPPATDTLTHTESDGNFCLHAGDTSSRKILPLTKHPMSRSIWKKRLAEIFFTLGCSLQRSHFFPAFLKTWINRELTQLGCLNGVWTCVDPLVFT